MIYILSFGGLLFQPPSGGCVLKHDLHPFVWWVVVSAAFGRLCVETRAGFWLSIAATPQPPSGGCVLKLVGYIPHVRGSMYQPPSGGCVLKRLVAIITASDSFSAAFGRLCVETT